MSVATHASDITIAVSYGPSPGAIAGFGTPIHITPVANTPGFAGLSEEFTSAAQVNTAETAGDISATLAQWLRDAFAQSPSTAKVIVAKKDDEEGYDDALQAAVAAGLSFYVITIASRADADIVAVSDAVAGSNRLFVFQSDDADWLSSGVPAGLSDVDDVETTVGIWHDDDGEAADLCWASSRLAYDPDTQSAAWTGTVRNVAEYDALTSSQRTFALANNINLGLRKASSAFFVSRGVNMNGRPVDHVLTGHWLEARWRESIERLQVATADRGDKLVVDPSGQTAVLGTLTEVLERAVRAGHLLAYEIDPEPITQTDIDAGLFRFSGRGQLTVNGTEVDLAFSLDTSELE